MPRKYWKEGRGFFWRDIARIVRGRTAPNKFALALLDADEYGQEKDFFLECITVLSPMFARGFTTWRDFGESFGELEQLSVRERFWEFAVVLFRNYFPWYAEDQRYRELSLFLAKALDRPITIEEVSQLGVKEWRYRT